MLSFFAEDVELTSADPFPGIGPARGISHVNAFIAEHLSSTTVDLTRKQVARERVTWTVKTSADASGPRARAVAQIALSAGRITSLKLGRVA